MEPEATDDLHSFWMRRALAEAARGRGAVEPNPMVGAILVRDGEAVGVGHHRAFGGPHAEVEALAVAGEQARGATLYVSLEPCCHVGKTPPCVDAVLAAGVARVIAALSDPFPRVAGGGFAQLRAAGIPVTAGVEEAAARRQNAPYLKRLATGRPFVIAKWAMTLDGKLACATGDSRWITNERSRALVHAIRGRVDGIVVGIGTALADDPLLSARPPGPRRATRIVLDSAGRLPPDSKLARTARDLPVLVVVTDRAPAERVSALEADGCEVLRTEGEARVAVPELLDALGRRGASNLLVEGGGKILGAFFDAGEVDAVEVFIAPRFEGGDHTFVPVRGAGVPLMADAVPLIEVEHAVLDGDFHIRGLLDRPWLHPEDRSASPDRPARLTLSRGRR